MTVRAIGIGVVEAAAEAAAVVAAAAGAVEDEVGEVAEAEAVEPGS